jgi:hypothetical protein
MGYKPRTDCRETSLTKRAEVYTHWKDGYSISQIVELSDLPCSTVCSIIDRIEENGHKAYYNKP